MTRRIPPPSPCLVIKVLADGTEETKVVRPDPNLRRPNRDWEPDEVKLTMKVMGRYCGVVKFLKHAHNGNVDAIIDSYLEHDPELEEIWAEPI